LAEPRTIDDLLEHALFARRLARALVGDEARADDVVQQTWLNALEHPPRAGRGLKAWLATVVRNTATKLRRDESRREAREQRAAAPEPLPSTAEVAAQLAAQRELLDAVARLDEPARSTIHARFFEERTPTQIAAALGIPVRTVETRLRRAIERLRMELDERVEGGRRAWVGLLVGGSVVAMKTKSASAIAVSALILATAATIVVTVTRHEWTASKPVAAPAAAVAQEAPRAAFAEASAALADSKKPAAAPTREALATAVTVFAPDGVGVPGAALVLFRGEEVLGSATTDANGAASVPIEDAPSRLLVFPSAAPAKVVDVAARTPSVEVTYDEGAILAGHAVVESRPPPAPIELTLTNAAGDALLEIPDPIPDAAWSKLRELRATSLWMLSARTASDGAFVFFGLPRGVRLGLGIPAPYEDAETGRTSVRFDEAREGVELALRFNPSIRGRIVDVGGKPLAGWKVEGWIGSEFGSGSGSPAMSDATGFFRLDLHERGFVPTSYAILYVCDPSGAFERRVEVNGSVDRGSDVGDVVVDVRRTVRIEAQDEAGRRLQQFAVVVERRRDKSERMTSRSERDLIEAEHARSGVLLPEEVSSLRVLAPGRAAVDLAPKPADAPVVATLPAAASLEVIVHDEPAEGTVRGELELASAKWPAAWSRAEMATAHVKFGGSPLSWHSGGDSDASPLRLAQTTDGRFKALALLPGAPITLVLRDRLGAEVLREEVVLQPGEARVLERTLAHDAVTLAGFVHEPDGTPIGKASIDVRTPMGFASVGTKADGRFVIAGLRAPRVNLVFKSSNHVWKWLRDVDVHAVAGDLDVELKKGRATQCSFVNARGSAAATAVWIESAAARPAPDGADQPPEKGDRCDGEDDGDYGFAFPDLPDGRLFLRARVEGFTFALPVEAGGESTYNAMLRGPIEIDWSIAPATSDGRTLAALRLLPLNLKGARATLPIDPADAARGSGLARIEKIGIDRYAVALVWSDVGGALSEEKTDVVVDVQRNESARVTLAR
jgi:RNA polymerase sigma-70 factor (ECF subfamily)